MWTEKLEKQFITMVEDRPSLFLVGKSYSNKQVKTESWRQISEALNLPVKELRKKWDSLRTQFTRYKKLPTSGSGAEKTPRQIWVLRRMQFLEPHMQKRESRSNLTQEPTAPTDTSTSRPTGARFEEQDQGESEREEDQTSSIESPLAESSVCEETIHQETQSRAGPSSKRRRFSPQYPDNTDLLRIIDSCTHALMRKAETRADDPVTATLKILEVKLRQAPPELLASLEHEMLNVIYNITTKHNQERTHLGELGP